MSYFDLLFSSTTQNLLDEKSFRLTIRCYIDAFELHQFLILLLILFLFNIVHFCYCCICIIRIWASHFLFNHSRIHIRRKTFQIFDAKILGNVHRSGKWAIFGAGCQQFLIIPFKNPINQWFTKIFLLILYFYCLKSSPNFLTANILHFRFVHKHFLKCLGELQFGEMGE